MTTLAMTAKAGLALLALGYVSGCTTAERLHRMSAVQAYSASKTLDDIDGYVATIPYDLNKSLESRNYSVESFATTHNRNKGICADAAIAAAALAQQKGFHPYILELRHDRTPAEIIAYQIFGFKATDPQTAAGKLAPTEKTFYHSIAVINHNGWMVLDGSHNNKHYKTLEELAENIKTAPMRHGWKITKIVDANDLGDIAFNPNSLTTTIAAARNVPIPR